MTHIRISTLGYGLALLLSAGSLRAQAAGWPYSLFEKPEYDFGFVAQGAEARFRIKLVNPGPETVSIVGVETRCTCATARALKNVLGPGETGEIEITFDTKKYKHERQTSVVVRFGAPRFAEAQIPVRVYIRTDVVITPGEAAFGAIAKGSSAERRLQIAYAGRPGWAIKDVVNKSKHVQAHLQELSRNGGLVGYELVVTLKPSAPAGDLREQLILVTDEPGAPQIPLLVEGRIETDYSVLPELVDFGTLRPGDRKTVNVIVRGRQPFQVETIESGKTAGVFEVRLPTEARSLQQLPLTVIAPAEPGLLDEELSITIKGIAEPLAFRAHCRIMPTPAGR